MLQRCYNENDVNYHLYGGRGIEVHPDWREDFVKFHTWSIENGYTEGLTIDRIDNDGSYTPSNCRWATQKTQCNNTSRNVTYTYNGMTKNITQWAEYIGINKNTLYARLRILNWSIEKALTTKV